MHGTIGPVCLCSSCHSDMEIPSVESLSGATRTGPLLKLTGRGWLSSGSWKSRFCVLHDTKLYFYESQQSKGSEKSSGVISLDYYDACEESDDKRSPPNGFFVGTSVRGFFDNRHQFAADSPSEMRAWMQAVKEAVSEARANRRKGGRKRPLESKSPDLSTSSQESDPAGTERLVSANKDRPKGPQGRRPPHRKSMMPHTTTRSPEPLDMRQRSISLSSPDANNPENDEPSEVKWLSLSLEEMEHSGLSVERQKSSSTADLPSPRYKPLGLQHAALARELEQRLKIGPRSPPHDVTIEDTRQDELETTSADRRTDEEMSKMLASSLKEAERVTEECKQALADAERARLEYQILVKECRQLLETLKNAPQ